MPAPRALARTACAALALLASVPGFWPGTAQAQDETEAAEDGAPAEPPAILVADRVTFDRDGRLVAEGSVEVLQGQTRMTAQRITYDGETGGLSVEGPIRLSENDASVLLASEAEISADLRDGILRSARLVLARQTQLAAAEARRIDGRFTRLDRVVASSCEVCAANPIPLWQIRASRVVRDAEDLQIYFDDARFEIYGVPVFYLPRLRLPDPSVERARGVLVPQISDSALLGIGARLPYFIPIGDSRDLTLTPYLAERTRTVEFRYRQAFRNGSLAFEGALSSDDLHDGARAYLFAEAETVLPGGFRAALDIESTSDRTYLRDYDYDSSDRLESSFSLRRTRDDTFFLSETIRYESLRSDESNRTQPLLVTDTTWDRRYRPAMIGGLAQLQFNLHGHERRSGEDIVGRDVLRITAEADWQRSEVVAGGLVLGARANLLSDFSATYEDSDFPDPVARILPRLAAEARWPLSRAGAGGRTHLIEPIAQIVWSPERAADQDRPLDESTQFEFDEGNLFALSRFPADDGVEAGLRANLGIGYQLRDPSGWTLGITAGRIVRAEDLGQFDGIDPLEGQVSDWLLGFEVSLGDRIWVANRALFDDDFEYDSFETRLDWRGDRFDFGGSYTWLAPSRGEGRPDATNEWRFDTALRIGERWRAEADWLYDLRLDRSAEAEIALEYRANCVTVDFGVRQRFTSENQSEPTTDFTLQIVPVGFGATRSGATPRNRACGP